jgi:hypothetical protein
MNITFGRFTSQRLRQPEAHPTLNGGNFTFVNHVKYLGVVFNERITWRFHIEMIEANFRTFIKVYSLFKSEGLSANIKLALHKIPVRSIITYAYPPGNLRQIPTY